MNRFQKAMSAVLAAGVLLVPVVAQAQEVTVRLEPGVAVPLTKPQTDRFDVGFDGAVKLDIGLTPFLDVVPGVGVLALPSSSSFDKTGTAWFAGGGLRLKRPHDLQHNTGSGFTAVSPWVDGDVQYVRTGDLNRMGWAVGAGAAVPTSDSRWLWVGPFVRYQSVFDPTKAGFDTSDAKVLVAGLSFEFGPKQTAPEVAAPAPNKPVAAPPPVVVVVPAPVAPPAEVEKTIHAVVQFQVDSTKLDATAKNILDNVAIQIKNGTKVSEISVEGHASSDGPLQHNNVLAQNRAKVVVEYLSSKGIDPSRLTAKGFGITRPVASNKTLPGRVANRRAEVVVSFTVKVEQQ